MGMEKEYTGTFFIGATTPCFDLEKPIDQVFATSHITEQLLLETTKSFTGKIQQIPPAFSAVMIDGKRAYELARQGVEAEIKPREIEIKTFEITGVEMPLVHFRVECSKGTYIRSLARDYGAALRSGAHLTALCRTRIGTYELKEAVTPQEFSERIKQY